MNQPLFSDFSPSTKQDWKNQVLKELKTTPYENLVWKDIDDFEIEALYEKNAESFDYQAFFLNDFSENNAGQIWKNRQVIVVEDAQIANQKALDALAKGADEILFDIKKTLDWQTLFNGIFVEACGISFRLPSDCLDCLAFYNQKVANFSQQISGSIELLDGNLPDYENLKNLKTILLYSQSSKPSDQVADLLQKMYEAGEANFSKIQFQVRLSNLYFIEIAKLRALRILSQKILLLSESSLQNIPILAKTTIQNDEAAQKYPYNNLLSNTTQAMSALLGNSNIVEITPFNEGIGEVNDFSERIARNISNLLREESYLDKVADPSAGSYYIEHLTDQIAQTAWQKLQNRL